MQGFEASQSNTVPRPMWSRSVIGVVHAGLALLLVACSGSREPGQGIGDGEIGGSGAGSSGDGSELADAAEAPGPGARDEGSAHSGSGAVPAGILTAGAWDDNRNFDLFMAYRAEASQMLGAPPLTDDEHQEAFARWGGAREGRQKLDVALIIDTTGSMGDEIAYLSSEFLALHSTIQQRYPDAEQRWSLVLYRDATDEYVVRWFDFRTNPEGFAAHLAAQTANGGGDYPEAPDQALDIAAQLGWRGDDTAKLAFWVADAPHHTDRATAMADALRRLRDLGVHIYPVAASGTDDLTELTMRSGAQLTGGRYLFLTDDSGVGNSHAVPKLPCFFVTRLNDAILRMVDIEVTGRYREPDASEILRTAGDPQSERCTLSDGSQVVVF